MNYALIGLTLAAKALANGSDTITYSTFSGDVVNVDNTLNRMLAQDVLSICEAITAALFNGDTDTACQLANALANNKAVSERVRSGAQAIMSSIFANTFNTRFPLFEASNVESSG